LPLVKKTMFLENIFLKIVIDDVRMPTFSKKITLGLGAIFFIASYFAARFPATTKLTLLSTAFILTQALPSYYYLYGWLGASRASLILLSMSVLPTLVEAAAVLTGFPYGAFHYSDALGYKVLNVVPWSVAFAYLPILLGSYAVAKALDGGSRLRAAAMSSLLVVAVDLVVDPGAVAQGLWVWVEDGAYYGVPLINYGGWLLTGFIYSYILDALVRLGRNNDPAVPLELSSSLIMITFFWTGFSLWKQLFMPFFIGVIILIFLVIFLMKSRSWK
jgi:putative membrane protein